MARIIGVPRTSSGSRRATSAAASVRSSSRHARSWSSCAARSARPPVEVDRGPTREPHLGEPRPRRRRGLHLRARRRRAHCSGTCIDHIEDVGVVPGRATGGAGQLVGVAVHRPLPVPGASALRDAVGLDEHVRPRRVPRARGCSRPSPASRWSTPPRGDRHGPARIAAPQRHRSSPTCRTRCRPDLPHRHGQPGGDARAGRARSSATTPSARSRQRRSRRRAAASASASVCTSSRAPG